MHAALKQLGGDLQLRLAAFAIVYLFKRCWKMLVKSTELICFVLIKAASSRTCTDTHTYIFDYKLTKDWAVENTRLD